ncbi:MAG: hypothetical protein WCK86_02205 [Planctomycetia bacterium]
MQDSDSAAAGVGEGEQQCRRTFGPRFRSWLSQRRNRRQQLANGGLQQVQSPTGPVGLEDWFAPDWHENAHPTTDN